MPTPPSSPPIHILWTGGWDSTYRVLDLALNHDVEVQPYYVLDPDRASTPVEIETTEAIRDHLARRSPGAAARVLPTEHVLFGDIELDDETMKVASTLPIGSQYGWLACFAKQRGFDVLEMCAVKGHDNMYKLLKDDVTCVEGEAGSTYRLKKSVSHPGFEIFRRFAFPLFGLTKSDMRRRAESEGILDLMKMTWFCFEPKGGKPCGHCTPCMVALESGMSWRVPPLRRIRPRLRLVKRAFRR